ncbi:MAG: glycosyltransferase family 2 protein [Lentimicrobiaceae bacterium]|nr:glycosyltransferase family 2 protein [Lentimicrobiaceae bacterium]
MSLPLVSIIIPCFNSASFMARAIESSLNQVYPDTEIILVDNNSTDDTPQVMDLYGEKYPGKVQVLTEKTPGPSAARNCGLRQAKGEWIQFLDSDDELLPDKIQDQVKIIASHPCDLVVGNYSVFRLKKKRVDVRASRHPWVGLITSNLGITSSNLWKKEMVGRAGGFNETWRRSSEEYVLLFDMLKTGARVAYDPSFHTRVYYRTESVSKSEDPAQRQKIWRNNFELRMQIRDYLKDNDQFAGEIQLAWDKYMYPRLVHLKYKFPDLYHHYMPELQINLPLQDLIKPIASREIRRILACFFQPSGHRK